MIKKTQKQYLENPNRCPFCNSTNIEAGHWNGETMAVEVICNTCEKQWYEFYKLTGYEEA
jgi:transcription elongation factor Elf1